MAGESLLPVPCEMQATVPITTPGSVMKVALAVRV